MAEIPKSEFKATGTIQDEMFSANLPAYVLDSTVRDVMKGLVTAVSQSGDKDAKGMKDLWHLCHHFGLLLLPALSLRL